MYAEILMENDDIIYIYYFIKSFPDGLDTLNVKVVKISHIKTCFFFYLKCIIYINDDATNGLR